MKCEEKQALGASFSMCCAANKWQPNAKFINGQYCKQLESAGALCILQRIHSMSLNLKLLSSERFEVNESHYKRFTSHELRLHAISVRIVLGQRYAYTFESMT